MIRLELTDAEARALRTICTSAEAGELLELMGGDGRRAATAQRVVDKVRGATRNLT